jgi:hypothetical protein
MRSIGICVRSTASERDACVISPPDSSPVAVTVTRKAHGKPSSSLFQSGYHASPS